MMIARAVYSNRLVLFGLAALRDSFSARTLAQVNFAARLALPVQRDASASVTSILPRRSMRLYRLGPQVSRGLLRSFRDGVPRRELFVWRTISGKCGVYSGRSRGRSRSPRVGGNISCDGFA